MNDSPTPFTTSALLIAICFSVLCLSGCGAASDGGPTHRNGALGHDSDSMAVSEARLAQLHPEASNEEWSALEDGVLTSGEYEGLVLSTIQCLEAQGLKIVNFEARRSATTEQYDLAAAQPGFRRTTRGLIVYAVEANGSADPADVSGRIDGCKRHSSVVEFLWKEHLAPTEADFQRQRDALGQCLRDAGLPVSQHPSASDLDSVAFPPSGQREPGQSPPEVFQRCDEKAARLVPLE